MTALAPDPRPALTTIPNVELVTVGEWDASTGPVTFSESDLRAAVAALDDDAIKSPRLRIGHTDPLAPLEESMGGFKEQPAFGRFVNLRLNATGTTIFADIAGVPAWLAEILPSAYPSRSIEAYRNVVTATGRKHDMVIPSVALLGVSMPAVETLGDLLIAYGAEMPEGAQLVSGERVAATRGGLMPERISASVGYEDIRQSFYTDLAQDERYWWWLEYFKIKPQLVIADDDEGGWWACPYSLSGDSVSWGDPYEVEMQWIAKDGGKVVASRAAVTGERVLASAADSRPDDRVRAATTTEGGTVSSTVTTVELQELRETLGMPEDASRDDVLAKLKDVQAASGSGGDEPPDGDDPPEPAEPGEPAANQPEPVAASVDPDALQQLQEDARLGREAREQQIAAERQAFVEERVKGGYITSASRPAHLAELEKGGEIEKAHRTYLASLTAAIVPVEERGIAASDETAQRDQVARVLASVGVTTNGRKEA